MCYFCRGKVQRDFLYDRYMPSEHHVLQVLLSQYPRDRFFTDSRELLLGQLLALLDKLYQ
jgi:hypothetical protein